MKLVLVADAYPPMRSSAAVQLRDLSKEFVKQGHDLTVLLPSPGLEEPWKSEVIDGVDIVRLRAPHTKDLGYFRRTLGEWATPYAMLWNLNKSNIDNSKWEGVIWYSPSIFHGPLVKAIKHRSQCNGYLIIRDIFPEWARDIGILRPGLVYNFLKFIAQQQYSVADIIGVQAKGNLSYFEDWKQKHKDRIVEVLPNWLGIQGKAECSLNINNTKLAGRKIFVYAGNMGVAQDTDIIIKLATNMRKRRDVGFVLVGRGSEVSHLKRKANSLELDNILFFDEIEPEEIPSLYAQCHVGIITLNQAHRTHNIPGKFISYLQAGLPILAKVNRGNDITNMIQSGSLGYVCENGSVSDLVSFANILTQEICSENIYAKKCKSFFLENFYVGNTAMQIIKSFKSI